MNDYPFQECPVPAPPTSRPWRHRAGHFVVTGFTGRTRQLAGSQWAEFRLPEGEQVPCHHLGRYGCAHWVSEGWMARDRDLVLCPACAGPDFSGDPSCGC